MKFAPDMFRSLLIGVLLLGTLISTARAGAIAVSPVRVQLSAQQSVSAVTVVNNAAEPALVQLVTLQDAMTGQGFTQRYPSSVPADEIYIINGIQAGTNLSRGMLLKRVVGGLRQ